MASLSSSILGNRGVVLLLVMLIITMSFHLPEGAVHKVGDSAGWTTIANVDYNKWALSKTFQVGDVIVFEYNPQFHNVMQVTHAEYKACNASSPITTHTTGNDTIVINTHGHHLFICGVPGHCQAGQKVDINVARAPSVAASPSEQDSPARPPVAVAAPSPSTSNAAPLTHNMAMAMATAWLLQIFCIFGLS